MNADALVKLFTDVDLSWLQATGTGVAFIVAYQSPNIFGRFNDRHKINKEFATMNKKADRKFEAAKEKKRVKQKKQTAAENK